MKKASSFSFYRILELGMVRLKKAGSQELEIGKALWLTAIYLHALTFCEAVNKAPR